MSSDTSQSFPRLFLMTNTFETGGSERQFVNLVNSLRESAFSVRIGCIAKRGRMGEELAASSDAAEFPVAGNLYGFASLQARWRLARYLAQQKIQIAQAFDFYTNLVLIPAARMARVPVVIGSYRQLGDLLTPAKRRAELAVLRWCDRVVCNSQAAAARLRHAGLPENRIVVIANGLPPSAFASAKAVDEGGPDGIRIGMVARMNSAAKNHTAFLRIAARLSKQFPDAEFLLAGGGPLRPELERYAADLGVNHVTRFLGDCSNTSEVFQSLDISVLPSASESLSNAVLESMAAGVPVVATDVGGNCELLGDDRGILVPLGDENAMAEAIALLLQNSDLRSELGRNARIHAAESFTIERVRKDYERLYTELLAKKAAGRHSLRPLRAASATGKPLKVGIVAASSRYVGGHSVQAELLLENFRNNPAISANLIPVDPPLPRGLMWVERIRLLRTIVRQPFYLAALWRGLDHADVAHIFSASYWSFLLAPAPALLIARLRRCQTVVHYHSGEARDHLKRSRIARRILSKAGRIVVPSQYLDDVFRKFGIPAEIIPNVLDSRRFAFRLRQPLRPVLLCTRGFHPYYAVDVVVRAFARVQEHYPEAELMLAGGGREETLVRDLVNQLRLNGVRFTGVGLREEIAALYRSADIFINASILDNMPVSIIEAFASGMPVVSTAPEGMRCLVRHERSGLLCNPGDERGLAHNVVRLLREPGLASTIAVNAREQASEYEWSRVEVQWTALYRSLAGIADTGTNIADQLETAESPDGLREVELVE